MSGVNKVILVGRLGKDPEYRSTTSGKGVANFTLATSERFKDRDGNQQEKTEWHRVVAWDRLAELARDYLAKGREVYVEGSLETRKWTDSSGVEKYTTEIKVRDLVFLGSRDDGGQRQERRQEPAPQYRAPSQPAPYTDDDIPF